MENWFRGGNCHSLSILCGVLLEQVPAGWREVLRPAFRMPAVRALEDFLRRERAEREVFPAAAETFQALELTPLERVRCVILGHDPYPTPGHAHGLAFSVRAGVRPPKSLVNIYKELDADLGIAPPESGLLEPWARQGVLLLNTVLTVRSGEAGSHQGRGWEVITDAVIRTVAAPAAPVVFVLWGNPARAKAGMIAAPHVVIESAHPSPLSAHRGFFGSRPFSRVNAALRSVGRTEIDWRL
jgi:uracil-DNA glycosylase